MPVDETKYFFSYARDDSDFALKLAKELRAAGANLWLDQLDIVGGQRWDHAVEEALATCQSMIVVLSPESVASNNVMDEVSYALEENKLVIPVLRKDCSIPFRLRRVHRIDFTADYDTGFADLLRALGIEQSEPKNVRMIALTTFTNKQHEGQVKKRSAFFTTERRAKELEKQSLARRAPVGPTLTKTAGPTLTKPDTPPVATESAEPEKQVAQEVEEPPGATPTVAESKPPEQQTPQRPSKQPAPTSTGHKPTMRETIAGIFILATIGTILLVIMANITDTDDPWLVGLSFGVFGALAGAISGTDRKVLGAAITGFIIAAVPLASLFYTISFGEPPIMIGVAFGWLGGPIVGALVGRILKKKKGWT